MRDCSALSEHFMVKIKIHFRISVENQRRNKGKKRTNRAILKTNLRKVYQERFNEEMQLISQEANINNTWEKIAKVIKDTLERILGYTQSEKKKMWFDENCKKVLDYKR